MLKQESHGFSRAECQDARGLLYLEAVSGDGRTDARTFGVANVHAKALGNRRIHQQWQRSKTNLETDEPRADRPILERSKS